MSTSLLGVLQHASLDSVAGCPFQEHKFTAYKTCASYFPLCGSRVGWAWYLLGYLLLGKEIETKKWFDVNLLEFCKVLTAIFLSREALNLYRYSVNQWFHVGNVKYILFSSCSDTKGVQLKLINSPGLSVLLSIKCVQKLDIKGGWEEQCEK